MFVLWLNIILIAIDKRALLLEPLQSLLVMNRDTPMVIFQAVPLLRPPLHHPL